MKPRWTIVRALSQTDRLTCACRWTWMRWDRNGTPRMVGCVGHHSWTGIVRRFEVTP